MGKTYRHMHENAAYQVRDVKNARKSKRERTNDDNEETLSIGDRLSLASFERPAVAHKIHHIKREPAY